MVDISDKEFKELAEFIKANYGIYIKPEKQSLVSNRLHAVLDELHMESFSQYYKYLIADKSGQAVTTLINRISTNHTFFMRENDHFQFFRDQVLPQIIRSSRDKDLKIWSAGCSSGEEPVTLAMIIDDYMGEEKKLWDTRILATDISNRVLEIAKQGIYTLESISVLPPTWRMNYFQKIDKEKCVLTDKMKKEIIYRYFNLMTEVFPFRKKFHVIFCRNVMIYFDNKTKDELVQKFYDMMEPGGYLFIGHSESLNRETTKYQYVMPSVYRKT